MPDRMLILYGTVEGQTRKIAEFLSDGAVRRGRAATLIDAAHVPVDLELEDYGAVLVASSVHMARHHAGVIDFVKRHAEALNHKKSAFISVSLSAMSDEPEDEADARGYVERFIEETGWRPGRVHFAAGALRFAEYDFFKRWLIRSIAKDRGVDVGGRKEIEFTDWTQLEAFVEEFLHAKG